MRRRVFALIAVALAAIPLACGGSSEKAAPEGVGTALVATSRALSSLVPTPGGQSPPTPPAQGVSPVSGAVQSTPATPATGSPPPTTFTVHANHLVYDTDALTTRSGSLVTVHFFNDDVGEDHHIEFGGKTP